MGWLSWVDMLAPPFNISFKGNENLKTNGGAVLTMMYAACFIFSCVVFIRDYLDTSKPAVNISEEVLPEDLKMNIAENGLLPLFTVFSFDENRYLNSSQIDTKFTFLAAAVDIEFDSDQGKGWNTKIKRFVAVPCSELVKKGRFNYPGLFSNYEKVKSDINRRAMCFDIPDTRELFINGTGFQNNDRTLIIRVNTCFHREDCESVDESRFEINVIYPQFKNVFKDKEKPFHMIINLDEYFRFYDWKMFYSMNVKTQSKIMYDSKRVYGEDTVAAETSFITEVVKEKDTKSVDSDGNVESWICIYDFNIPYMWCKDLIMIQYKLSTVQQKYTRTYTTLVGVLSEIGGISSIIIAVFAYVNGFLLNLTRKKLLVSKVFPMLKHVDQSKGKKYRDELYEDAVEVIDSYFDIANIFQDLACLKLLINLLIEENQQNLATIYPLYDLHVKKAKEKEKIQAETILRKNTIQQLEATKDDTRKLRSSINIFHMNKNKPQQHIAQLASYISLASKRKIGRQETPEEGQASNPPEPAPFNQQLHDYIDREVDKMLLKGFEKLSINLDPEFSKALLTTVVTEGYDKLYNPFGRELDESRNQHNMIYDSSIKGRRQFKQDFDIELEQVQLRKPSLNVD